MTILNPLTAIAKTIEFPDGVYKVGYRSDEFDVLRYQNKIYDFRREEQGSGKFLRPLDKNPWAIFGVTVNGDVTKTHWADPYPSLDEDPTYVEVSSADEVKFINLSGSMEHPNKYSNNYEEIITREYEPAYIDLQYLIYPDEGKSRYDYPIVVAQGYRGSLPEWKGWQGDEKAEDLGIPFFEAAVREAQKIGVDCYVELYMAVGDVEVIRTENKITGEQTTTIGPLIWSTNGTFGMWKTTAMGSPYKPGGNTWYFTEMLIRVNHEPAPDFYPTTDKYLYVGNPGDTVNVDVKLNNNGVKGTTNLGWIESGGSWSKPNVIASSVTLDEGEYKDYKLEFEVPEQGQEKKVTFRANLDDKTPASEVYLENNQLTITIKANEEQYIKSNLTLSEKRITEKHDLKDIGGIPTFTFEYPSAGYHTWTECDDDG